MASRPAPRDLRASDADRERVVALLSEAAADGRLTLGEHSERAERAYSAQTLGALAELTADLAAPSAQPIQLDGRRSVAGIFGRELRAGHWVVPERLAVSAIFGEVTLDLRDALLASRRVLVFASVIAGTLRIIVPDEVAVEVTHVVAAARGGAGTGAGPAAPPARADRPVIDVRAFTLAGRVRVIRPRRPRWPRLRRPGSRSPVGGAWMSER